MAVSSRGSVLTDGFVKRQKSLVLATVKDVISLWPQLNVSKFDDSWPGIRDLLKVLIGQRHQILSNYAVKYYNDFRAAEGASGVYYGHRVDVLPSVKLDESLDASGRGVYFGSLKNGKSEFVAKRQALTAVAGSSSRLVASGGRGTVEENVKADKQALGFARITKAKPCYFCAMLASRGFIYKSAKTAGDPRANGKLYHDHCSCVAVPSFFPDDTLPESNEKFQVLWDDVAGTLSAKESVKAFRKAYENLNT